MERMSVEEFINNVDRHITSLKDLDNKALKILVGKLEEENKKLNEDYKVLGILNDEIRRVNKKLREENKKLKHENSYRAGIVDILPKGKGHIAEETIQDLQKRINELNEENRKLKETIKDHQLYEEKLEHRIIEFEELLHGE